MPLVSVLMPVYNGALYLKEAIDSILHQTFTDFELIIVDDCSKDNSAAIIKSYSDKRIIFIQNTTNRRTSYCLNVGIEIATGKYLARMDQDDISLPSRLEMQVQFMEQHPEIGISGTQLKTFGENIVSETSNYPSVHEEVQLMQMYVAPFAHPTVIMRKDVLDINNLRYVETIIAEDYSLWGKLLLVTKASNLPQVLFHYRRHPTSITRTFYKTINKERKIIQLNYCENLFGLENNAVPKLIYSRNPFTRKIGLVLLKKHNKVFDKKLLNTYLKNLNQYYWSRNLPKYYANRLVEKIKNIFS